MVDKQVELVEDIITFFQKLGASNELSDRNFRLKKQKMSIIL